MSAECPEYITSQEDVFYSNDYEDAAHSNHDGAFCGSNVNIEPYKLYDAKAGTAITEKIPLAVYPWVS